MIKTITFISDFRTFKNKETYTLQPGVNLLVGDQGSGKSSLISELRKLSEGNKSSHIKIDVVGPVKVFSMDFEKDTPRSASHIESMEQVLTKFASHGEVNNLMLRSMPAVGKNVIVILDEPDTALSIRSCIALVDQLKKAEQAGAQIICAVHNPVVIEAFDSVVSLEHKKIMSSKDFIKSQQKPRKKSK